MTKCLIRRSATFEYVGEGDGEKVDEDMRVLNGCFIYYEEEEFVEVFMEI